ncbi:MAG: transcription antitermination factor NusB [Erysipelotrichaceae bacterium]
MKNRHQLREQGMTCLYQSLILHKDIKQVVFENTESNAIDPFLFTITIDAMNNFDIYKEEINKVIKKDWTFDRLGFVERAILVMACSELENDTASRSIVFDEAITLTKKYCDADAYKLVNAILEAL